VAGSTVNEQGLQEMIRGRKGSLFFSPTANKVELKPEAIFSEEIDAENFSDALPLASVPRLEKNWFDCIRSGKTPLASIDLALKAHVVLALAEMSERTGFMLFYDEATRQVKSDPTLAKTPIIAVSSFAMKGDEEKARASGCDHYVTKPYSPLQLLRTIRGVLGEQG